MLSKAEVRSLASKSGLIVHSSGSLLGGHVYANSSREGGAAVVAMRDNGVLLTALPFRREREREREKERERGREERERERERVQIEGGRQEGPPPYSERCLATIMFSTLEAFVVCHVEGHEFRSQGITHPGHASDSATRGGDRVGALLEAAWTLVTRG